MGHPKRLDVRRNQSHYVYNLQSTVHYILCVHVHAFPDCLSWAAALSRPDRRYTYAILFPCSCIKNKLSAHAQCFVKQYISVYTIVLVCSNSLFWSPASGFDPSLRLVFLGGLNDFSVTTVPIGLGFGMAFSCGSMGTGLGTRACQHPGFLLKASLT